MITKSQLTLTFDPYQCYTYRIYIIVFKYISTKYFQSKINNIKRINFILLTGINVPLMGFVSWQSPLVLLSSLCGTAVWLTIDTIATDKFTLMAYTKANPRNPKKPSVYLAFIHDLVSDGISGRLAERKIILLKLHYESFFV